MTVKPVLKSLLHCQVEKKTTLGGGAKTSGEKTRNDMDAELIGLFTLTGLVLEALPKQQWLQAPVTILCFGVSVVP